jgi:hypothetical protein
MSIPIAQSSKSLPYRRALLLFIRRDMQYMYSHSRVLTTTRSEREQMAKARRGKPLVLKKGKKRVKIWNLSEWCRDQGMNYTAAGNLSRGFEVDGWMVGNR